MRVKVECIRKADRQNIHERIEGIGGVHNGQRWFLPQQAVIEALEKRPPAYQFFVQRPGGPAVDVVVASSRWGHKYLKTAADGEEPNNLLALPECPR